MNGDAISSAMMWVGALMVLTPMLAVVLVIHVLWYQKRKRNVGVAGERRVGS